MVCTGGVSKSPSPQYSSHEPLHCCSNCSIIPTAFHCLAVSCEISQFWRSRGICGGTTYIHSHTMPVHNAF
jgi:hypothetical protein